MPPSPRRRTRPAARIGVLLTCAVCLAAAPASLAANEKGLQVVWDQHIKAPDNHTAAIKACQLFLEATPDDPLVAVVHQIEAWHHLRAGRIKEAEKLLQPYLTAPAGAVNDGAKLVARGWFSRLDRGRVAEALQAFYRKEVGYPEKLAEVTSHPKIPDSLHPPLTDRFGKAWVYKLTGFGKKLSGFKDQRYSLESPVLGSSSDLAKAVKATYASGLDSPPLQVWDQDPPMVKFKLPGGSGTTAIKPGQKAGDVHLAYAGKHIVVICNHSYWKVFPRP